MKNYGNSFVGGREAIDAGKVPVWLSVDEQFPSKNSGTDHRK